MIEWVECIRHKLSEMGILNPKGNLYTKMTPTKTRNPMSPLPQPPSEENVENLPLMGSNSNVARSRTSIVDVSDQQNNNTNQSFTTSIYLNQDSSATSGSATSGTVNPSQPVNTTRSAETVTVTPPAVSTSTSAATSVSTVTTQGATGATSSVYLNKSNPTRHVTVIPINKAAKVSF